MTIAFIMRKISGWQGHDPERAYKDGDEPVVPYTTRPPREHETEGIEYHFISEDEFFEKEKNTFFAETTSFRVASGETWHYGSAAKDMDDRKVIIVNPHGLRQLKKMESLNPVAFYITADEETIRMRLKQRGDDEKEAERRIDADNADFAGIDAFIDYSFPNGPDASPQELAEKILFAYKKEVGKKEKPYMKRDVAGNTPDVGIARNENDIRILKAIIKEQNAKEADLPTDLSHWRYGWENGRLVSMTVEDCNLSGMLSLTGLDALKILNCGDNRLTALDVSGCSRLEGLVCKNNPLGKLDVSGCRRLTGLYCYGCRLEYLDTGEKPLLEYFVCSRNLLKTLDMRGAPILNYLDCSENCLTCLNIGANPALKCLDANGNQLKTLDVSRNHLLKFLDCRDNPLKELDVSRNPELELFSHDAGVRVPEEDAEPDMEA